MTGRKKPYTARGISRVKCFCGRDGVYQWNCCAINNRWVAICAGCDIKLNEMVLAFFRVPNRAKLMKAYKRKVIMR